MMANDSDNIVYEIPSCIRGFHVYKETWVLTMDKVLQCQRETQLTLETDMQPQ